MRTLTFDNSTQAVNEANLMLAKFDEILRQSQREFGDLLDFKIELIQSWGLRDKFSVVTTSFNPN